MTTPLYRLILVDHIAAGTSAPFRANLLWDGAAVQSSDLSALTMSLFDRVSGAVINEHYNEDVLSHLAAGGAFEYELTEDDNVLMQANDPPKSEEHCVLLTAEWTAGARRALWLVQYVVDPVPLPVAPAAP